MQSHTHIGGECIQKIEERLGGSNFLQMAREIALNHHERWDGGGYPAGLAGENIPLSARIVAVADVYDALSVRRIYKDAFPHEDCVAMIREQAGKQFDPVIVETFLQIEKQFEKIARRFSDYGSNTHQENDRLAVDCECSHRLTPAEEQVLVSVNIDQPQDDRVGLVQNASA